MVSKKVQKLWDEHNLQLGIGLEAWNKLYKIITKPKKRKKLNTRRQPSKSVKRGEPVRWKW